MLGSSVKTHPKKKDVSGCFHTLLALQHVCDINDCLVIKDSECGISFEMQFNVELH